MDISKTDSFSSWGYKNITKNILAKYGYFLLIGIAFVLPLSVFLLNVLAVCTVLAWIIEKKWNQYENDNYINKGIMSWVLLYIGLAIIAFLYNSETNEYAKYKSLKIACRWIFILFWAIWLNSEDIRNKIVASFSLSIMITNIVGISRYYFTWPASPLSGPEFFLNAIYASVFTAFAVFINIQQVLKNKRFTAINVIAILLGMFYVYYLSSCRAGQLILSVLLFFTCIRHSVYKKTNMLFCLIAIIAICSSSNQLKKSWLELPKQLNGYLTAEKIIANSEINHLQYDAKYGTSSLGERFAYLVNSYKIIITAPWLGHGLGSFNTVYKQLADEQKFRPTTNPHNEWLLILVEKGIVGLVITIFILWKIFMLSNKLPTYEKNVLQGLLILMVAGNFANSWFFDFGTAHLFYLFVAWALTAKRTSANEH